MGKRVVSLDLTRRLTEGAGTYTHGTYRDPDLRVRTWSTIEEEGFWVSIISIGTQSGTHIDAPAHFKEGGPTLDALDPHQLWGRYLLIDLNEICTEGVSQEEGPGLLRTLGRYDGEPMAFMRGGPGTSLMKAETLEILCNSLSNVWVLSGSVEVAERGPYFFYRRIAEQGIYLIEDLDEEASRLVRPGGEIVALPLRLSGVSGSPCRVLVRQEED